MRATAAVIATLAALALGTLWIGTTHRDRCMKTGEVACSIVPWSGHPAPKPKKPAPESFWQQSKDLSNILNGGQ